MIPGKRIRKELIQWKKWMRNLNPSYKRETQQTSTHMQKCLIPLLLRSLQIKTRKRCHCIPNTKQHFKTLAEMKIAGNFAMGVLRILDKTWVYLVKSSSPVCSDTASAPGYICSRESGAHEYQETWAKMHSCVVCNIPKLEINVCQQKWIDQDWYIHKMECCRPLKMRGPWSQMTKSVIFVMLSEWNKLWGIMILLVKAGKTKILFGLTYR